MKKALTVLVAAAAISAGAIGLSSTADAHWYGPHDGGWGPGPFIAGAFVAGAVAAAATSPYFFVRLASLAGGLARPTGIEPVFPP